MTAAAPLGAPVVPFPTVRLGTEVVDTRSRALVVDRPEVWFDVPDATGGRAAGVDLHAAHDTAHEAAQDGAAFVRSAAGAAAAVAAGYAADQVVVASDLPIPARADHPALWLAPGTDRSTELASVAWALWHGYRLVTASDVAGAERVCRTVEAILAEVFEECDG